MGIKSLWSDLPPQIRTQFESSAQLLQFRRGEVVYRQGDSSKGIFFVKSGLVGLMIIGAKSGKEHLLRFFKMGQFFGHRSLFSEEPYHASAISLETTEIALLPKEVLIPALEQHPKLLMEVARILSKELRRCENQHVMILENEVVPRVGQSLIYLQDIKPDHSWTRQEIANFCGSTVSTVIKAMAELENRGLIRQEGRAVEILDRDGLLSLQDEP